MSVDVSAIRAACERASQGEWEANGALVFVNARRVLAADLTDDFGYHKGEADAELIVLLRNNAEALLDELRHSEEMRDSLRFELEGVRMTRTKDNEYLLGEVAQAERRGAVKALTDARNAWQRGQWANAPRCADRVQERIANAQYVTEWLDARVKGSDL